MGPGATGGSGIPQPSMLRNSRLSMAPGGLGQIAPGTIRRNNKRLDPDAIATPAMNRGWNNHGEVGAGPMSQLRNPGTVNRLPTQTPANKQNRRTSVFQSSRRQSVGMGILGSTKKTKVVDPRPLKTKQFRDHAKEVLGNFLRSSGYPGVLGPKTLDSPSQREFREIFTFLYGKIDPRYQFQQKFESDVFEILRSIRYPYHDDISKTSVTVPGIDKHWVKFLALFLWMIELIQYVQQLEAHEFDDTPQEGEDMNQFAEKAFYQYLKQTYPIWLAGSDETTEFEDHLAEQLDGMNSSVVKGNEEAEQTYSKLEQELHQLHSTEPPLVKAEREKANLMSDKVKMSDYIHKIELRRQKQTDRVNRLRDSLETINRDIEDFIKGRSEVKAIVDSQPISTQDVDRMQAEQEQLSNTLEGIQVKIQEAEKVTYGQEMKVQQILDNVDNSVQEYSTLAYNLGLLTSSDDYEGGDDAKKQNSSGNEKLNFRLKINHYTDDPSQMASVDLRNKVRPALQKMREDKLKQLRETRTKIIEESERAEQLAETKQDLEEQIAELDGQVQRKQQQYQDTRMLRMAENKSMMQQIEQLDVDIAAMRKEVQESELHLQALVAHTESEWDMVRRGNEQRRKEVTEEVVNTVDDVLQMSSHVQQRLRELKELVDADAQITEY
ncbi:kinetochore-associated Ndc80 complex subunit ndc80 [Mycoemilia scoparia]|uniref:Kinetochore protein NDC80 n=1 Tax=Mycoemilia scoparia TaxID=417184 RepID=A0A9W8DLT8_9FUNG|nr:kinetochore-associated Ndc80 complex subunit ndc80 [Mycoemilia scoparia]